MSDIRISHEDKEIVSTYFAPAERADPEHLTAQEETVRNSQLLQAIVDSMDGYMLILNEQRQALAANEKLLKRLDIDTIDCLLGDRPGEIFRCVHVKDTPGGCGTGKHCRDCGAAISILQSQKEHKTAEGECLATVNKDEHTEALEFRVRVTPIEVSGNKFTILVFNDITAVKRRDVLERTFFHDVLNTVGECLAIAAFLLTAKSLDSKAITGRLVVLSRRLSTEIQDQRKLIQAENETLQLEVDIVPVDFVFEGLASVFEEHDISKNRSLIIDRVAGNEEILTDSGLLGRVLTNMLKNAFEAIDEGQAVRISFERRDGCPTFSVHNPGMIPEKVARQIFQRSFSTKSKQGRGIGTYSMKLFGEQYLKGKVGFETSQESGTRFYIQLPEDPPYEL